MNPTTRANWSWAINLIALVSILLVPFVLLSGIAALGIIPGQPSTFARISLALVFAFTGMGHFAQTKGMMSMLPPWMPARRALILASGVLECTLAAALVVPGSARAAGIAVMAFLVVVFPSNVYAAAHRVPFGGHGRGPSYLVPRGALQLLLFVWAYFSAVAAS